MATYPPLFQFAINLPTTVRIKFVDVRPGKQWPPDPQTGEVKPPSAQVTIKGTFDGVETMCYLKGKAWANLKALSAAGIIEEQDTDALEDTAIVVTIPLIAHEEFVATLSKPASEKYANMVYRPVGGAAPVASKRVQPPSGGANNQPFDLPARAEIADLNESDPWDESPYVDGEDGEQPPVSAFRGLVGAPAETPRETAADILKTQKRDAIETAYFALWQRVAAFQIELSEGLRAPDDSRLPPKKSVLHVDGVSVNACASTVWIDWQKKGLV